MKKTYITPTSTALELTLVHMLAASNGSNSILKWNAGDGTGGETREEGDGDDLGEIG